MTTCRGAGRRDDFGRRPDVVITRAGDPGFLPCSLRVRDYCDVTY
ncbi:hypothetical protein AB0K14_25700 [Actinosynnema sp. NPDC050801]